MPLVVALVIVVALVVAVSIAVGHERGPGADDTAVAYVLARARGDWSTVFDLSAQELRAARDRPRFVADHRDPSPHVRATSPRARVESATVTIEAAAVVVHVDDPDLSLRVDCARRDGRWAVTGVTDVTVA